jgi:hypothetical protein
MDLVLFLLTICFVVYFAARSEREANATYKEVYKIVDKICPPHKWEWVPIHDEQGNKVIERIICSACGCAPNSFNKDKA